MRFRNLIKDRYYSIVLVSCIEMGFKRSFSKSFWEYLIILSWNLFK